MRQQIFSRFDLVQYCLRKLGAPVIKINVTEQQIDDRINDALDMFLQFHMDGSYREIIVHNINDEDIARKKIILQDEILSVLSVHLKTDPSNNLGSASSGNLQMQMYFSDVIKNTYSGSFGGASTALGNYVSQSRYIGVMGNILPTGITRVSNYKVYQNELTIPDINWNKVEPGLMIGLECYVYNDPDSVGKVYNDYWLKQYATALIRLQWGNNLSKYQNVTLPGSTTLNGEAIVTQAQQEISDLEMKLRDQFSLPILPFMG